MLTYICIYNIVTQFRLDYESVHELPFLSETTENPLHKFIYLPNIMFNAIQLFAISKEGAQPADHKDTQWLQMYLTTCHF